MALMISLDDAMGVLIRGGYLGEAWDGDDKYDYVRNELEQKCYSIMKPKSKTWFDEIKTDIECMTSAEEIGKHIVDGDLRKWLEFCRDSIIAELAIAVRQEGR